MTRIPPGIIYAISQSSEASVICTESAVLSDIYILFTEKKTKTILNFKYVWLDFCLIIVKKQVNINNY